MKGRGPIGGPSSIPQSRLEGLRGSLPLPQTAVCCWSCVSFPGSKGLWALAHTSRSPGLRGSRVGAGDPAGAVYLVVLQLGCLGAGQASFSTALRARLRCLGSLFSPGPRTSGCPSRAAASPQNAAVIRPSPRPRPVTCDDPPLRFSRRGPALRLRDDEQSQAGRDEGDVRGRRPRSRGARRRPGAWGRRGTACTGRP
ncbi:hypothetical protein SKAU_G00085240 [Synaphobranchus kaupii]|uniref:Uncharacterized protein n=1 Tax=Synaphobranchus kaupii TaxID=118154 RepID=A0A9Q1FWH1_SYNKA|nr:hypothetical protein SKAU_G00085240 [Synaphobranchus kaupii]